MSATHAITRACRAWILRATPAERREYLAIGSRGPGMPVDVRPASFRALDVRLALRQRG